MLKSYIIIALVAVTTFGAPAIVDKNGGFENASPKDASLPLTWDFADAPTCSRVTTGDSPQGKARVNCALNSAKSKSVSFTQPVSLKKNEQYVTTSVVRFHLPPKAAMDAVIRLEPGGLMAKSRACGYAYDGPNCDIPSGKWVKFGGADVLISQEAQTLKLRHLFTISKPGGGPVEGSVEVDKAYMKTI